jgi:hypothetical protein
MWGKKGCCTNMCVLGEFKVECSVCGVKVDIDFVFKYV